MAKITVSSHSFLVMPANDLPIAKPSATAHREARGPALLATLYILAWARCVFGTLTSCAFYDGTRPHTSYMLNTNTCIPNRGETGTYSVSQIGTFSGIHRGFKL